MRRVRTGSVPYRLPTLSAMVRPLLAFSVLVLALTAGCVSPRGGGEENGYAIYGEVERSGVHTLSGGEVTALEAVLAARPRGTADLTQVVVMRDAAADPFAVTLDLVPMIESGDTSANILLRHGDIVVVPPRDGPE